MISKVLIYLMYTIILLIVTFISSLTIYSFIKNYFLPKAIINERLYFDFSKNPPIALLNLELLNHDSKYLKDINIATSYISTLNNYKHKRFLTSGLKYNFLLTFKIPYSKRNQKLGKAMTRLTLYDSEEDYIARSYRPIILPYKSHIRQILDSIFLYPLILFGIIENSEFITITLQPITKFMEPKSNAPGTSVIEVELDPKEFDIEESCITVMPIITGFSYYLYYYPILTLLVSVFGLMVVQIVTAVIIYLSIIMIKMNDSDSNSVSSQSEDISTENSTSISPNLLNNLNDINELRLRRNLRNGQSHFR